MFLMREYGSDGYGCTVIVLRCILELHPSDPYWPILTHLTHLTLYVLGMWTQENMRLVLPCFEVVGSMDNNYQKRCMKWSREVLFPANPELAFWGWWHGFGFGKLACWGFVWVTNFRIQVSKFTNFQMRVSRFPKVCETNTQEGSRCFNWWKLHPTR